MMNNNACAVNTAMTIDFKHGDLVWQVEPNIPGHATYE